MDPTFALVNFGCPKNEVDAEQMAQILIHSGNRPVSDPRRADIVIVNTCGFIRPAAEESLSTLRSFARRKRQGQLLIVAGCLAERQADTISRTIPAIDGILGTRRCFEIADLIEAILRGDKPCWVGGSRQPLQMQRLTPGPSAYIKICDGCDVGCTFCTIPLIKGRQRSKPPEAVLAEARELVANGVREIVLIGQDTTAYGRDLGMGEGLADLLTKLCLEIPDLPWIRLMYGHPGRITPRLIDVLAQEPRVLKYLDIPLQHAHPDVLARMGRPRQGLRRLVADLRIAIDGLALRSAFIVGFPGETEYEFAELLAFLSEAELDRVGIFEYSREEGTAAAGLPEQVSEQVKKRRYAEAMQLQQAISRERNRALVGRTLPVLVEGQARTRGRIRRGRALHTVGRSYRDAPEVDGLVFIRETVPPGKIVPVRITEASDYDLVGELAVSESISR